MRQKVTCPEHGSFFVEPGGVVQCQGCLNPWPPGVLVHGNVKIGAGVAIGAPADINGKDSSITIGEGCDIASFVTINCADSHLRCIGLSDKIERLPIVIEDHVFIGQGAMIFGGTTIGHHAVIGAGVILKGANISPYSLVTPPPPTVYPGTFDPKIRELRTRLGSQA